MLTFLNKFYKFADSYDCFCNKGAALAAGLCVGQGKPNPYIVARCIELGERENTDEGIQTKEKKKYLLHIININNTSNQKRSMLMKKINFILTFLLAWLTGGAALADDYVTVNNYVETFENQFPNESNGPDFTPAAGWGHYAPGVEIGDGEFFHVKYTWYSPAATFDINGELCSSVYIGSQTYASRYEDNDMLVTPEITGKSSFHAVSASYSQYGYVDVYVMKVDENGQLVPDGAPIYSIAEGAGSSFDPYSGTVQFDIPEVQGKHLGIRGNYARITYFQADKAVLPEVKKLSLKNIPEIDEWANADADGNYTIAFDVTVKNAGTVDLDGNEENLTISVIDGNGNVIQTLPVPALAVGATSPLSFSFTRSYNDYPDATTISLRNDYDGSVTSLGTYKPSSFAPKVRMTEKNMDDVFASGSDIYYGKSRADVTKTFTINNDGGSDLNVTSLGLPEGFISDHDFTTPLVVRAHSYENLAVTLALAEGEGVKEGQLVLNNNDGVSYSVNLKGEIVGETTLYAGFEDNKMPVGFYSEDNSWAVKSDKSSSYKWYPSNDKYNVQVKNVDSEKKFVTPRVEFAEGETLEFEAAHASYGDATEGVNVYYSADGKDWTLAKAIAADELSADNNWGYYKFKRFVVNEIPAGVWYVAFGSKSVDIDNICGGTLRPEAHAWVLSNTTFPKSGVVNSVYTAKITLLNNNVVSESGTSYDVTLYENDEEVASTEGVDIASGETADLVIAYTPHHMGEQNLKLVVEANDADYSIEKDAAITVSEELALSDVQIGTATDNVKNIADLYYKHSEAEVLLPASKLGELKNGDKIGKLVIRGTSTSQGVFAAKVWIANTDKTSLVEEGDETFTPSDTEEMKLVFDDNFTVPVTNGYYEPAVVGDLMTITFSEPFVYDGNGIRLVIKSEYIADYCMSAYFEGDTKEKLCYMRKTDYDISSISFNEQNTPVVHFYVANDPLQYTGAVTDKSGNAIAGADVTLRSDNVEYYATTGDDGSYTAKVVKSGLDYDVEVEAPGYKDTTEPLADLSAAQTTEMSLYGFDLDAGDMVFMTFPFSATADEIDETEGKIYELTSVADGKAKFNKATSVVAYKPYLLVAAKDQDAEDNSFDEFDDKIDLANESTTAVEGADVVTYLSRRHLTAVDAKKSYHLYDGKFNAIDFESEDEDAELFRYTYPFEALLQAAGQGDEIEVELDETPLGISEVNASSDADANAKVYNVAGVRVSNKGVKGLKSGLYIKNGKKVVVK